MNSGSLPVHHVFLVEDDDDLRGDLHALIEFGGYRAHAFRHPLDFLEYSIHVGPVVVLSDLRMPGMSGLELHQELLKRHRQLPFIVMSGASSDREIVESFRGGVLDFLLKPFTREELFAALARGIELDLDYMTSVAKREMLSIRLKALSPRELQVFELLKKGFSNQEILSELHISLETTKQYKQEVMRKLQLKTLSELLKLSEYTN